MKALILAAGRGTRISRYLQGRPKCTVDIGGETLIHYTVRMLLNKGISDVGIVVGYRSQAVIDALSDLGVKYYYNPFFDVTNSIASAWFAMDFIGSDMLMMNGDVFVEEPLLDAIMAHSSAVPVLFSDETRKEEADYKLYYENSRLIDYGKELTGDRITGEYIGIAHIPGSFTDTFRARLSDMIAAQEHGVWWENVLYSLSDRTDIAVSDIGGRFWAEVDYVEDYERILTFTRGAKD